MTEWKLITEIPPPENTTFQVAWCGAWYPHCRVIEGLICEYTIISGYQNYMDWEELEDFPDKTNMYWAPLPELP